LAITIKTIGDLKEYRFFVPSYQRGYRWTEQEVTALLDDVKEFSTEGNKQYCIQPLIVKRRDDGAYEVVDGQQRLTTIFIFMKIAEEKTEYLPFKIEYETRKTSQTFLSGLDSRGDINKENIDYFHITKARNTINCWLDKDDKRFIAITDVFKRFIESVIFIWYEMPYTSDPITMFTKVNLGKIPLTNAELIKALLFNKDNFSENRNKRQAEISLAWDRIEQGLHEDSFWCFLNKPEQSGTRIDVLFELLAKDYNIKRKLQILANQNYFSFLVFLAVINMEADKEQFVMRLWGEVEKLYSEFRDWYADLDKYHIIGYLIAAGVNIDEIFNITNGKRKSAITKDLLDRARRTIPGGLDKDTLVSCQYDYNREKIRNLLLLFNIATLVCKSEKQNRFPFDIFKRGKWDIEHIHANADGTDEADDSLWNLALLDYRINRSPEYAAKTFDEKRKIIIERESKGLFVPLCTINVFLKVYSSDLKNMAEWGDNDKADYIAAIEQILKSFFKESF
jgi:hypothetical protein